MGRIRQMINVQGRESWTLFDSGARNTYIVPAVAALLTTTEMAHPIRTALGGTVREANTAALLEAEAVGHTFDSRTRKDRSDSLSYRVC